MISRMHAVAVALTLPLLALLPGESFGRGFGVRPSPFVSARHAFFQPPHRPAELFRHRRPVRSGFAGITPYGYASSDYGVPYLQPVYAEPKTVDGISPTHLDPGETPHPGRRSYPVTVPSETGGTRLINTVRC